MNSPIETLSAALADRYRIGRELGAGGMATVYLAHDLKHDRDVAMKVLHPDLGAVLGGERFLAEIRTTARLQHPHILPLLDSGDANGLLYYVMPLITGETLRARLQREQQLPVDDAIRIAREVADALGCAHSLGVIHRDIKPENILLQGGHAVVADFGIALAVQSAGGQRMTQSGLSLGTPQYMSPEQAMGERSMDARTDIYALGAVTYEMLVGEPPFTGPTLQAIVARILSESPRGIVVQRKAVSPGVEATVLRALEKLPADRFATAEAFAEALRNPNSTVAATGASVGAKTSAPRRTLTLALGVALVGMTALAGWALFRPARLVPRAGIARFTIRTNDNAQRFLGGAVDAQWGRPGSNSLALAPNGQVLVYAAWEGDTSGASTSRLYVRKLSDEQELPLAGTETGSTPFISPDGVWVGYFAGHSLKRVRIDGGQPETVVSSEKISASSPAGASWGDDGTIVFAVPSGLYQVTSSGGEPTLVLARDTIRGSTSYNSPHVLPGSRTVLIHANQTGNLDQYEILALDLATRRLTSVIKNATDARYVSGQLLFMRLGRLMSITFNPQTAKVSGDAVTVADSVMHSLAMPNTGWDTGAGQFAISASGHLVYAAGGEYPERPKLIKRVEKNGVRELLAINSHEFTGVRVSPSGDRLAVWARDADGNRIRGIYIHDLTRGVTTRLNTGGSYNTAPAWSPDGRSIAYSSNREAGVNNVYQIAADGSSAPTRLVPSNKAQTVSSWSSTGVLAYLEGGHIWMLPPGGVATQFFESTGTESFPTFSPDGRWLAYVSSQTGRREVYVRPYPGPGAATQISGDGGSAPLWSPTGRQLTFFDGTHPRTVMSVDIVTSPRFLASRPKASSNLWTATTASPIRSHDVFPDGSLAVIEDPNQPALLIKSATVSGEQTRFRVSDIHIVLNFLDELRTRVK